MTSLDVCGAVDAHGEPLELSIRNGKIATSRSGAHMDHLCAADVRKNGLFDAKGLVALPGFIDVQTNGGYGDDFTRDPESIWRVGEWLPSTGVTSFCPTIITSPEGTIEAAQAAMGARPEGYVGAEPLGLHIEGPHLSAAKRGTHPADLLRPPSDWSASTDHLSIVTIAPELEGAIDLIGRLSSKGVVVSIGHSAASAATATAALDAGATFGTHLLNAMPPMSARHPGIAGVLLTDPRASFGMIVDDVHLAPEMIRLVWNAGGERFILITDAIAAAGMPDGTFDLGDVSITHEEGAVRNEAGDLAGSSLTMDRGLRNIIAVTNADLATASRSATTRPADLLGRRDLGRLTPGSAADIVLLNGLDVVATITRGTVAFNRDPDRVQDNTKGSLSASP